MEQKFYTVDDIMKILCIGKSLAYDIIKDLNAELEAEGLRTCRGRVHRRYFEKRYCYQN